jgi:glycine/sarcosine N-methyltransferase
MQYEDFYNDFSDFYDTMTGFEKRFQKEEPFFKEIIKKYGISRCLDIGCGTGFHSFLLTKLGMEVTGIDPSKGMIEKANKRLEKSNLNIEFVDVNINDYIKKRNNKSDAVLCLGNTLPHIMDKNELEKFFKQVKMALNEKGVFILQMVNYNQVLKNKERILNIKEENGKIFIRFYDFLSPNIIFNILTITRNGAAFENKLISTELYPYKFEEIEEIVNLTGFRIMEKYGNIRFKEYEPNTSENIILILS